MTTLDADVVEALVARLEAGDAAPTAASRARARRPVHVVYGGAHLFREDTARKLGARAIEALDAFAPDTEAFARVFGLGGEADALLARVRAKLTREPIEDFRIDFEDGFGARGDDAEDDAATSAGRVFAAAAASGSLPPLAGIRVKSLDRVTRRRALATLDRFVSTVLDTSGGALPAGFVVTLPKVTRPDEVAVLAEALARIESRRGLASASLGLEIMVETPEALITRLGTLALPGLVRAAEGRCVALHLGAYDYGASLGVAATDQSLSHPACVLARQLMRLTASVMGVAVSDGATNLLPVPVVRVAEPTPAQRDENQRRIHAAWRLHFDHVRQALREGFACGWDLHPAQLVARYAAVYAHFGRTFEADAARLRSFVASAGRASLHGDVFDDAASALGLLNAFVSAVDCGAASEVEVERATGLSMAELRARDFAAIVRVRPPVG